MTDAQPPEAEVEAGEEVATDLPGKLREVSREEVEEFLGLAVKLFLKGGGYLHYDAPGFPEVELRLTDETLEVNVRRLDRAVAWRLSAPEEVGPPAPDEVLSRWRILLRIEDEPVATLGRGVPGVQVKTGRASFILFRDFVRAFFEDKSALREARRSAEERELLRREIEHSRERAGIEPATGELEIEPGEESLLHVPPPPEAARAEALGEERRGLRERYR